MLISDWSSDVCSSDLRARTCCSTCSSCGSTSARAICSASRGRWPAPGDQAREAGMTDRIDGLAAIADRYDGYVFDVWGTLYDGGDAFPEALTVLRALAAAGKAVVVLSNSPRMPMVVAERLARIGLGAELYREIITSGGESQRHLKERSDPLNAGLGPRALSFAPSRVPDIRPGTGIETTADHGRPIRHLKPRHAGATGNVTTTP